MSLEKLLERNANITGLGTVETGSRHRARKMLLRLEETEFYDKNSKNWRRSLNGEDKDLYAQEQLLGVWAVNSVLGKNSAWKSYLSLRDNPLYEDLDKLNVFLDKDFKETDAPIREQMLGIAVQMIFDKEIAGKKLDALKKTGSYDHENGRWDAPSSAGKLMRVLVEGVLFNKDEALNRFNGLGKIFWDSSTGYWKAHPDDSWIHTYEQLLALLVEGTLRRDSKERIRQRYEFLKSTPLFNNKMGLWNVRMNAEEYNMAICTKEQLMGVLVEKMLEEPHFSFGKGLFLPEVRSF